MINFLGKILGMKDGSSGKRQVAGLFALVTLGIIVWRMPALDSSDQANLIEWMLLGSVALIAAAWGMHSLIEQAGFSFKKSGSPVDPLDNASSDRFGD